MSYPVRHIDAGTIVAAICALKNAVPLVYGKPHYQNFDIATECIHAIVDLELIVKGIQIAVKIESVDGLK